MAVPTLTRVCSPVARRIHDRIEYWKKNGPMFGWVNGILYGKIVGMVPLGLTPVALVVAAYPSRASAGMGMSITNEYTGIAEIAVCGSDMNAQDGYEKFIDTIDDVVKIVGEVEQKTAWDSLTSGSAYGETIRFTANRPLTIDYPEQEKGQSYSHLAIVRWEWAAHVAWEA